MHRRSTTATARGLTPLLTSLLLSVFVPARHLCPAAGDPDWPQFRGPRRDGVSTETGLLKTWPPGGPKRLWSVSGLGRGYSCPTIVQDSLYITGDADDTLRIFAFDLEGKPKWDTTNGQAWKSSWAGARASCTYDAGRLYHMNGHGRAACLDPATGKEVWAVDVLERFKTDNIRWGISENLLVDGDRVLVTPGGGQTLMAALDKKTGETVWSSGPLDFQRTRRFGGGKVDPPEPEADKAGYASPVLFEAGGRRLIAGCSANHFFCVDAESGKIVWTRQVPARYEVIGAMPILCGDSVFFSAPDEFGGLLVRAHVSGGKPRFEELWRTDLDNCHGALVFVDGHLYGAGYRRLETWACIDVATGQTRYTRDEPSKGAIAYADGRLYALGEDGLMVLWKPTLDGFETTGEFRLVENERCRDAWAHPVICRKRLYLRYHDDLHCYDIAGR